MWGQKFVQVSENPGRTHAKFYEVLGHGYEPYIFIVLYIVTTQTTFFIDSKYKVKRVLLYLYPLLYVCLVGQECGWDLGSPMILPKNHHFQTNSYLWCLKNKMASYVEMSTTSKYFW